MANVVFFAFASVPDQKEKIESGPSILVGDLKYRIAEKKFLPIQDIALTDEGTGETLTDDTWVSANASVLVKRIAAKRRKPRTVVQASKKQKIADPKAQAKAAPEAPAPKVPTTKRPFPKEFLCCQCNRPFAQPRLFPCCGGSLCLSCVPQTGADDAPFDCPMCTKPGMIKKRLLTNKALKQSVLGLDWDCFEAENDWHARCLDSDSGSSAQPSVAPSQASAPSSPGGTGTESESPAAPPAFLANLPGLELPTLPEGLANLPSFDADSLPQFSPSTLEHMVGGSHGDMPELLTRKQYKAAQKVLQKMEVAKKNKRDKKKNRARGSSQPKA